MSYFIFSVSCVLSVCLVYEGADASQGKEVMRRGSDFVFLYSVRKWGTAETERPWSRDVNSSMETVISCHYKEQDIMFGEKEKHIKTIDVENNAISP
jgi:hypothetical protein